LVERQSALAAGISKVFKQKIIILAERATNLLMGEIWRFLIRFLSYSG
jgi:hypothetical protein